MDAKDVGLLDTPVDLVSCPGCSGRVLPVITHESHSDVRGICESCRGVLLATYPTEFICRWCECKPEPQSEDLSYYWRVGKGHGWLHRKCGQVIQTG